MAAKNHVTPQNSRLETLNLNLGSKKSKWPPKMSVSLKSCIQSESSVENISLTLHILHQFQMSNYKRAIYTMVDQFQTAEQLRTFMNMYGFQEEPYLKEKLFYLCSSEVESEDINSAEGPSPSFFIQTDSGKATDIEMSNLHLKDFAQANESIDTFIDNYFTQEETFPEVTDNQFDNYLAQEETFQEITDSELVEIEQRVRYLYTIYNHNMKHNGYVSMNS